MNILFKPMTQEHALEVMDIFNYYIKNSYAAYPESPLPVEFFMKVLEMTKGYPAFVIQDTDTNTIRGFCFLRAYNPFPTFHETAEITYFLRHSDVGKGMGKKALERLEEEAKRRGIKNILANISSENEHSIQFHLKNGFRECGRFHQIGRKNGKSFDVVWMEKAI
jgi:phosphinothricin acetyltransferase